MPDIYDPGIPQLTFDDQHVFELFISYLQQSFTVPVTNGRVPENVSLYNYFVRNVTEDTFTCIFFHRFGVDNAIGKFFLEIYRRLPVGFTDEHTHLVYQQPVVADLTAEKLDERYRRGISQVQLARQGGAIISEGMMRLLKEKGQYSLAWAREQIFTDVDHVLLLLEIPAIVQFIIKDYLPLSDEDVEQSIRGMPFSSTKDDPEPTALIPGEDGRQSVTTRTFFSTKPDPIALKRAHGGLVGLLSEGEVNAMPSGAWQVLIPEENGLLEIGKSKTTGKPGIATSDYAIYLTDEKERLLTVLDKRKGFKLLKGDAYAGAIIDIGDRYADYQHTKLESDLGSDSGGCVIS